jgi:class 3 adenylate cyclase
VALPLLGLWLLLAQPRFDVTWENQNAHLWLIFLTAAAAAVIAVLMGFEVRRRADARLFLVSLMFLTSSGFLALHALATPTIILDRSNVGFIIATPMGLLFASFLALLSAVEYSPSQAETVLKRSTLLTGLVFAGIAAWGALTLLEVPPFNEVVTAEQAKGELLAVAIAGAVVYGIAAALYYRIHRRRPAVMLLGIITAFVLLAESMFAQALARNWHASWWEWHLLMGLAFAFVAYSAAVHYRREGTMTGLFRGIALEESVRRVQRDYNEALESLVALVAALGEHQEGGEAPLGPVAQSVGERFGLTPAQVDLLERAADALSRERRQTERLRALVRVGHQSSVMASEEDLLDAALSVMRSAFPGHDLRLDLSDGSRAVPGDGAREADGSLSLALSVRDNPAGVLNVRRARGGAVSDADRWLLEAFANQLSISLENARLYGELSGLFHQYMSSNVASLLVADPGQAALGGAIVDVTVLFADLGDFTSFSEKREPQEVVDMLNAYYGAAAPAVLAEDGTIDKFVGDAMMALFNAPVRQPDHALRACRAALAMQEALRPLRAEHPDWPAFRIGVNTGPALVGNIGSAEVRNFTAIGDAVNVASRLEALATPGQVVVSEETYGQLAGAAEAEPLGELEVKGRGEPVRAYVLKHLTVVS